MNVNLESEDGLIAGRYRRLGHIGAGGMARVYLAQDEKLGRKVAVKRLHSDSPDDAAGRFEREARLGASLNHPNLVSVYDIETEPESVLIVMEYVEGQTLRDVMADGPLGIEQAISVVRDVGAALDHAHAQGVVHRDVKPANILIRGDGVAKLADLGIAKAAESTQLTSTGMVVGTASYMAPEQLDGSSAGPATDIYALSAVMYEALGGEKARDGSTPVEIAHQVANNPVPDLRNEWENAPPGAAEVLKRGMARDPADRPESAGQLARDLEKGLREGATAATAALPAEDRTAALPAAAPVSRAPVSPPRRPSPAGGAARKRSMPAWLPVARCLRRPWWWPPSPCSPLVAMTPRRKSARPGPAGARRRSNRANLKLPSPSASRPSRSPPRPSRRQRSSRQTAAGGPILRGAPSWTRRRTA